MGSEMCIRDRKQPNKNNGFSTPLFKKEPLIVIRTMPTSREKAKLPIIKRLAYFDFL